MSVFKNIGIVIVLLIVIVISAMNSILFITHPELSYGTPGMYHISIIFMLLALGLLYLLSRFELNYIKASVEKKHLWKSVASHQTILVNITAQAVLYLILEISQYLSNSLEVIVPLIILFVSVIWLRTIKVLFLKSEKHLADIKILFGANIIFTAFTVYLTIHLFLMINAY
ncbi:hypothetical protein [Peloplasma aerotolerans]|uniref:DUF350 domain-containing protein n=1 Tax=Peloplasma aerotolerans TaxID=3044389 RepID=A0AAW6U6W1_9MOLU|nr:hypothetical protein [Mariniplasma sp. M4Ah]MDI6453570.1 hypothetical protein [Mariniplasma sp. M4Ah]